MMQKILFPLLVSVLLFSCGEKEKHHLPAGSLYYQLQDLNENLKAERYLLLQQRINSKRNTFAQQSARQNEIKNYLLTTMVDSLFQFWYDTDWDFNGVTEKPGKGSIACGYFVTTTLKHAGLDIDRVKIAQQASSRIIRTLCDKKSIQSFYNKNFKGLKKHLQKSGDGLYIIGLDNHVGFIHKKDTSLMVIHSDANTGMVCRQRIDECGPIKYSKVHVVGNLLDNDNLIKSWLERKRVSLIQ